MKTKIETPKEGGRLVYNDGRPGHSGVGATILEIDGQWMQVQFDDRASTTMIHLSDRKWMDFISFV